MTKSMKTMALLILAQCCLTSAAWAQPSISVDFIPDTIASGDYSMLVIEIANDTNVPVLGMNFSDDLPVQIDVGSVVSNGCGGNVQAIAGGQVVELIDGVISGGVVCQIEVSVTSVTQGTHTNPQFTLNTLSGDSSSNAVDLNVVVDRPSLSKSFTPDSVDQGGISILSFVIDNSNSVENASFIRFTDQLPVGLEFAENDPFWTDCPGSVVAINSATQELSFSQAPSAILPAGSTCTVLGGIRVNGSGTLLNQSSTLTSSVAFSSLESGFAEAVLTSQFHELEFIKNFTNDPAAPGSVVELAYDLTLLNRNEGASNITFTDDLSAALAGLSITDITNTCGGSASGVSGTVLSFSGGSLAPEQSCQILLNLQVPQGATPGDYSSTSSGLTYELNGSAQARPGAVDVLRVSPNPTLAVEYLVNPAVAGGTTTVEFMINNTSVTSAATAVTFQYELTTFLPFPISANLPPVPDPPCGAGSSMTLNFIDTDRQGLVLNAGNIAAGGSCTFTVDVDIPVGFPTGRYTSTTSSISATVDGATRLGLPATTNLDVVAAPQLSMNFIDDPVLPGDTVTVEYQLEMDPESPLAATNINFSHDLDATLLGLVAIGLPQNDVCGVGSVFSGTGNLSLVGGSLQPSETCVFSVTLQVPAGAVLGSYPSTTSTINATVSGLVTDNFAASDNLDLTALVFSKNILPATTIAAEQENIVVEFTIENLDPINDATAAFFTDNLAAAITGWSSSSGNVNDVCGTGSQISGTTFLIFTGGIIPAGGSCTFAVDTNIPVATAVGTYSNITSNLTTTIAGSSLVIDPAADDLDVVEALQFSKTFVDDPVPPGGSVTLEFVLTNLSSNAPISGLTFTDDLDAVLSGLQATGLPAAACGGTLSGTSFLTFTGGSLAAGAACTISVDLSVPALTALGQTFVNTTSTLTGSLNGVNVTAPPATDELILYSLELNKAFVSPVFPGQLAELQFTINELAGNSVSGISFSDDLSAMLPFAVAVGLPVNGVCGSFSALTGSTLILLDQAQLEANQSCQFSVMVQVPMSATPGAYLNTTSTLISNGIPVGSEASATLLIASIPLFSMQWQADVIAAGQISTALFTIDNSASSLSVSQLSFNNSLPAGLTVASPANASTTCTGGTLTAASGGSVITYAGGTVAANGLCTIAVDVQSSTAGIFFNISSDLLSSAGNSGTASDTLTVDSPPLFNKIFLPNTAAINQVVNLVIDIDNTANILNASGLDFTDNLPPGMVVANPSNLSTNCQGVAVAPVGGAVVGLTGGEVVGGGACALSVDIVSTTTGPNLNTTGDLTSSSGNSGTASATLTISGAPLFSKAFNPSSAQLGEVVTLTFNIDNSSSSLSATALDFTDNFPAGMTVANPSNAATTCIGGTVTAVSGAAVVGLTGGTVADLTACTVVVDVASNTIGLNQNISGDLTSSLGNSGPAQADLTISGLPSMTKSFDDAQVFVGQATTLRIVIDNSTTALGITGLNFSDDLPVGMAVATPDNLNNSCAGTATTTNNNLSLTGGVVNGNSSCEVSVDVIILNSGTLLNQTSVLSTDLGNVAAASASIDAVPAPGITKSFATNDVIEGSVITVDFSINNTSTQAISGVSFTDDLDAFISGATAVNLPQNDVCGLGSTVTGTSLVTVSDVSIPANSSCLIQVDIQLPSGLLGAFTNITSVLEFTVNGQVLTGGANTSGSDSVNVVQGGAPVLVPINQWTWLLLLVMAVMFMGFRNRF